MSRQIVGTIAVALEIAGSVSGVPYLGAVGTLVREILESCENIRVHKKRASSIRHKCISLTTTLEDRVAELENTGLSPAVDETIGRLTSIRDRMRKLSRQSSWQLYTKSGDVGDTLRQCESDLDLATQTLTMQIQLSLATGQRDIKGTVSSTHAGVEDIKYLLQKVLSSGLVQEEIATLRSRNIADQVMEAAQQTLHGIRDQQMRSVMVNSELTASPASTPLRQLSTEVNEDYQSCSNALYKFHLQTGVLPSIKVLDGEVTRTGDMAVDGGTYSDVWLGKWLGNRTVALKALRNIRSNDLKARKRFEHEIRVWSRIENEHILPFYGIVTNLGDRIHVVSAWQENGNVLKFLEKHPDADRHRLASVFNIKGAADGLQYLHTNKILHGNVKCRNILVTDEAEACICDFGMSKLVEEVTETSAFTTLTAASGGVRWLAPELINGAVPSPTFETDTYSFGMTILELVTGRPPFAEWKREASIVYDVVEYKKTPRRPDSAGVAVWLTDELWELLQQCWQYEASQRPQMAEVKTHLDNIMK